MIDAFSNVVGEFDGGYSTRLLRGGKVVYEELLNMKITSINDYVLVIMDSDVEYGRDFFAYDSICDAYSFLPGKCFTTEKSNFRLFVDKSNRIFGTLMPFEARQSWKHDGVKTMDIDMISNKASFNFNLYMPYHLQKQFEDSTLSLIADYALDEDKLVVQTNFDDLKLVLKNDSNIFNAEFTRFGDKHFVMNLNMNEFPIQANAKANYLQLSDSFFTKVLCSGLDCFEREVIVANGTFRMYTYS